VNGGGYGVTTVKHDGWYAHRLAWLITYGTVPDLLRHKCDNPRCVRVSHLEPGTPLDNMHDAISRGRRPSPLTPQIVRELRKAADGGKWGAIAAAARKFKLKYMTAYGAATRRSWEHIDE